MKVNVFAILGVIGFVFLLGTAGASDLGSITVRQLATRLVIGLICILVAVVGQTLEERHERSFR